MDPLLTIIFVLSCTTRLTFATLIFSPEVFESMCLEGDLSAETCRHHQYFTRTSKSPAAISDNSEEAGAPRQDLNGAGTRFQRTRIQKNATSSGSDIERMRTAFSEDQPFDSLSGNEREQLATLSPSLLLLAASLLVNLAMALKAWLATSANRAVAACIGKAIGVTALRIGCVPSKSADKISRLLMQETSAALPSAIKGRQQCSAFCAELLLGFMEVYFPESAVPLPARRSNSSRTTIRKRCKGCHGCSRAKRKPLLATWQRKKAVTPSTPEEPAGVTQISAAGASCQADSASSLRDKGRLSTESDVPGGSRASHTPAESASSVPESIDSWPGSSWPQVVPENFSTLPAVRSLSGQVLPLRACSMREANRAMPAVQELHVEPFMAGSAANSGSQEVAERRLPPMMVYGGVHGMDAYTAAASLPAVMYDLLATSQMVMMRQCEMQERQVAIADRQAELAEQRVRQGEVKVSMKERRQREEREEKLKGSFGQSMADFLMAGMAAMMATLALTVYHLAPSHLWAKMDECMATHQKPAASLLVNMLGLASWMDSLAGGFHWLACSTAVLSSCAVAFIVIAAMAAIFVGRDASEYHKRPIFRIFVLLIVICGGLGFYAMQGMGGHGPTWLAFWELMCAVHFLASLYPAPVSRLFYHQVFPVALSPDDCSQALAVEEARVLPYRMAALFFFVVVVLPVAAGSLPFLVNS